MAADFSGPFQKKTSIVGESKLQVVLGFSEDHKVVCVELTRETKIRGARAGHLAKRVVWAARLLSKRFPAQCQCQPKEKRPVLGLVKVCRKGNWQSCATYTLSRQPGATVRALPECLHDVHEGAESMLVMPKPKRVHQTIFASICLPAKTALTLIETTRREVF